MSKRAQYFPLTFGSIRSSRSHNLCSCGPSLSRAHNLNLSGFKIFECPVYESESLTLSTAILVQCCGSLLSLGGHTITGHIKGIPHWTKIWSDSQNKFNNWPVNYLKHACWQSHRLVQLWCLWCVCLLCIIIVLFCLRKLDFPALKSSGKQNFIFSKTLNNIKL